VKKPAYSVSFLLSINIFVWQNVLYFPNDPSIIESPVVALCKSGNEPPDLVNGVEFIN